MIATVLVRQPKTNLKDKNLIAKIYSIPLGTLEENSDMMSREDQVTTNSENSDSFFSCNNNINTQGLQQGTRPSDQDVEDNQRFSSSSSDDDRDIVGRHYVV